MDITSICITSIDSVCCVYSKGGTEEDMNNRKTYGLSFCKSGKITYEQNGREYVSDSSTVILLPKGANYRILRQKSGEFPVVNFTVTEPFSDTFLCFPCNRNNLLFSIFEELRRALVLKKRFEAISLFYKMLSILSETRSESIADKAELYLQDNLSNPNLSNATIAKNLLISESYLSKQYIKAFGTSLKQSIILKRMALAKQLLCENHLTVGQICEQCGYTSIYTFSRAFKAVTGFSPTDFRQAYSQTYL